MTPTEARRLGRSIHRRMEWITERCWEVRDAAEAGDALAAAVWEGLEAEQIGVTTDVNLIVRSAIAAARVRSERDED
jgi:hypothetical protein